MLLGALIFQLLSLIKPKNSPVAQVKEYKHIRNIYGPPEDKFERPHDVAVDSYGNLYITDAAKGYIASYDRNGNFLKKIGRKIKSIQHAPSDTKDQLLNPIGITVSNKDNLLYVADRSLEKIVVFTTDGKYVRNWKVEMPVKPYATKDRVYVATHGPFYIYDKKGKHILGFGKRGRGLLDFDFPNGVLVSEESNNIFVADSNNYRIKALDLSGQIEWIDGLNSLETKQTGVKYGLPNGLTFDDRGLLYSVDSMDFVIRVFALTKEGPELAGQFGEYGTSDGQLNYPGGIAYLGGRRFAVADEGNKRVQILEIPVTKKMQRFAKEISPDVKSKPVERGLFAKIVDLLYLLIGF